MYGRRVVADASNSATSLSQTLPEIIVFVSPATKILVETIYALEIMLPNPDIRAAQASLAQPID